MKCYEQDQFPRHPSLLENEIRPALPPQAPGIAIVAIARKLLVVVWHVLTERVADTHAEPVMVAGKLMRWSWRLTPKQRGGLTSRLSEHLLPSRTSVTFPDATLALG